MTQKIIAFAGVLLVAGAGTTAEAAKKRVSTRGPQELSTMSQLMKLFDEDINGVCQKRSS